MTETAPRRESKRTYPKQARVTRRAEFDLAFDRGRRASSSAALLLARRNELPLSRIGISIGRKFGNSVERNRAKRLLREAFRFERSTLPPGFDYIVVPRSEFPDHLDGVRAMLVALIARATSERPGKKPT